MSGTYAVTVGDRGRFVLPVALRERWGLEPGTPLLLLDTDDGVVLATRAQAARLLRRQLGNRSLVDDLTDERQAAAQREDG